jgi:hypothetical protein
MEDLIATISGGMHVGQQANDLKDLQVRPTFTHTCLLSHQECIKLTIPRQSCRKLSTRLSQHIDPSLHPLTHSATRPYRLHPHLLGTPLRPRTISSLHPHIPQDKWRTPASSSRQVGNGTSALLCPSPTKPRASIRRRDRDRCPYRWVGQVRIVDLITPRFYLSEQVRPRRMDSPRTRSNRFGHERTGMGMESRMECSQRVAELAACPSSTILSVYPGRPCVFGSSRPVGGLPYPKPISRHSHVLPHSHFPRAYR